MSRLTSLACSEAAVQRCFENIQQIYRRTPVPKRDFNDVAATSLKSHFGRYACSPVNLLHIFRTPFPKNIFGRLLLPLIKFKKCPQVIHILTFWFIFSLRKCMLTIKMQCQEYKLPGLLILSSENKLFFVTYLFVSLFIYTFLSNIFTFWEFGQSRQKIHKCVFIFLIYIS